MGGYLIFDISFSEEKDRQKFEKKYKIRKKDILVSEKSNSRDFVAWTMMRDPCLDIIYYIGFRGYADPKEILKECKKAGINIKFLSWLSINDKNSTWTKEKGRW